MAQLPVLARRPQLLSQAVSSSPHARCLLRALYCCSVALPVMTASGCNEDCFESMLSLTCPGSYKPEIFCSKKRCLWISTGKPAGEFSGSVGDPRRVQHECEGPSCPDRSTVYGFIYLWGLEPWTRTRALNVRVRYDRSLSVEKLFLHCTDCRCDAHDNHFAQTNARIGTGRVAYDTFILSADFLEPALLGPGASAATLVVEIDHVAVPAKARACVIHPSDGYYGVDGADCAGSGVVTLSEQPTSSNGAAIAATVDVQTHSWRLRARFPPEPMGGQIGGHRNSACPPNNDGGSGDAGP